MHVSKRPGFSTDSITTFYIQTHTHIYTHVVGESDSEMLEKALHRMSDRVQQRRVLTKPCFQDFDKYAHVYTNCYC